MEEKLKSALIDKSLYKTILGYLCFLILSQGENEYLNLGEFFVGLISCFIFSLIIVKVKDKIQKYYPMYFIYIGILLATSQYLNIKLNLSVNKFVYYILVLMILIFSSFRVYRSNIFFEKAYYVAILFLILSIYLRS